MQTITLSGKLVTGLGEAVSFTRLDWAREQFIANLGIDPYPGTLNIVLGDDAAKAAWARVKATPGKLLVSPRDDWCNARCYPARIVSGGHGNGYIKGGIVFPEIESYPEFQVEIIAETGVRAALGIEDGDAVTVEVELVEAG